MPLARKRSPDGATFDCSGRHLIAAYYSFIDPERIERLHWPSWLTYSGQYARTSGHPSAVGRAQDMESLPFYHSAMHQQNIRSRIEQAFGASHRLPNRHRNTAQGNRT